jgi:CubicO group peptidase (beta-lactamase class C family)
MAFTTKSKRTLAKEIDAVLKDVTTPNINGRTSPLINGVIAGVTDGKSTVYLNGAGVKDLEACTPIDVNNQMSMFSCNKSMTAMAILILYERKQINLDIGAGTYLPEIDEIGMITKGQVNREDGTFITPPTRPKYPVTVRQLLLHTAGFSYGFLSKDYLALQSKRDIHINVLFPTRKLFTTDKFPLINEPGTKWNYGHNTDWLGLIVEAISGQTLGQFLKENVFDPVGMTSTTFRLDSDENLIKLHRRKKNKEVVLMELYQIALDPEVDMGGQGSFSTVGDYLKFIRVWLNYGLSPDTGKRILKESTVRYAVQNHLPPGMGVDFSELGVKYPKGWIPDGFTLTGNAFGFNNFPTGRPKGVLYWSGLGNLYYWIDMENQIGGFWGSQLLPFMDPYSLLNYAKFEMSAYDALKASKAEKKRKAKI